MRITSKGQVTIPLEVRERLGLLPNTEVEFTIRGDAALVEHLRGRAGMTVASEKVPGDLTRPRPMEPMRGMHTRRVRDGTL